MAEQYTERPTEIEVFPLGSETDVILRKSIAESETTGENGDVATCWQCEERQIRVPGARERAVLRIGSYSCIGQAYRGTHRGRRGGGAPRLGCKGADGERH